MIKNIIGVSRFEKPLIVWHPDGDFQCYDGQKEFIITEDEFKQMRKKYTFIRMTDKDISRGIIKAYDDYITTANALKKETKGLINIYKCGSFGKTALYVWNKLCSKEKSFNVDKLTKDEEGLLLKCKIGGIIFGSKYTGSGYSYDFKSFYPSILSSNHFLVPYKCGQWKTITKLSEMVFYENLTYGYYRCIIHKHEDNTINRFFRFNKENIYTHFDIKSANILGLKVKLINDGQPNVYYYTRKEMKTGIEVFGKFVSYMYKLKEKDILGAKLVLNSLWGALCEAKHNFITVDNDSEYMPDGDITDIKVNTDGTSTYYIRNEQIFTYDWARIKPFLLSRARLIYAEKVFKYSDSIVRCHTDSIISTVKLDIETGVNMGSLTYEGYYEHFELLNKNRKKATEDNSKEKQEQEELKRLDEEFRKLWAK
jgi:hypothetical protein